MKTIVHQNNDFFAQGMHRIRVLKIVLIRCFYINIARPGLPCTVFRLELNSQTELNLSRSSSGGEATNYTEVATSEGCPRQTIVLNVEYIEELRSELHMESFCDRDVLHE